MDGQPKHELLTYLFITQPIVKGRHLNTCSRTHFCKPPLAFFLRHLQPTPCLTTYKWESLKNGGHVADQAHACQV